MEFASPFYFFFCFAALTIILLLPQRLKHVGWVVINAVFISILSWRVYIYFLVMVVINFYLALLIHQASDKSKRRFFLWVTVAINASVFIFLKYGQEYISFNDTSGFLSIGLPVGMSFLLFRVQGYVIDVFRKTIPPTRHFLEFLNFSTFFLTLFAGPIERYSHFSQQLRQKLKFNPSVFGEGLFLILLGLFKRYGLIPYLAKLILVGHPHIDQFSGFSLLVYCVLAAFEMYFDFSSYVDIVRGLAKLCGIQVSPNFNLPYLATGPFDLWRRWHMSFLLWLRDYIYTPLLLKTKSFIVATTVLFGFVGIWHNLSIGTFLWVFYWIIIFVVARWLRVISGSPSRKIWAAFWGWFVTFLLVSLSTILIASRSLIHLKGLLASLFSSSSQEQWRRLMDFWPGGGSGFFVYLGVVLFALIVEILHLRRFPSERRSSLLYFMVTSVLLLFLLSVFGQVSSYKFIYFVF